MKIHSALLASSWKHIRVEGGYERAALISTTEKSDKMFNWQRPTAISTSHELVLKCFPGKDYVLHYGLIVATYLAMTGRNDEHVSMMIPRSDAAAEALRAIDFEAGDVDLTVVGWGLPAFTGPNGWSSGNGFMWKKDMLGKHRVLFVGFLHSIWGDVAGSAVTRLAECGAKRVVYVGKVGSLDPAVEPNKHLATGSTTVLEGETLEWDDFFAGVPHSSNTISGLHVSSPSILLETKPWLNGLDRGDFVDPEIGHMGRAAARANIEYGYLHVISNNLARERDEDLSNERRAAIVDKRKVLLDQIRDTIISTLDRRAP
ncbi:hypothetical protein [Arthrobacter sp. GAS37]|uniref:hypothetical protein n=1 Tax=Arthrobacter sp. GAS37 TaxID=3156261 RepID=UPI0038514A8E